MINRARVEVGEKDLEDTKKLEEIATELVSE